MKLKTAYALITLLSLLAIAPAGAEQVYTLDEMTFEAAKVETQIKVTPESTTYGTVRSIKNRRFCLLRNIIVLLVDMKFHILHVAKPENMHRSVISHCSDLADQGGTPQSSAFEYFLLVFQYNSMNTGQEVTYPLLTEIRILSIVDTLKTSC